jgi:hypothetical protein
MSSADSFIFKLSTPIKIHGQVDGENHFIEVREITLKAPSYELLNKNARKIVRNLMHKFKAAYQDFSIYRAASYEKEILKAAASSPENTSDKVNGEEQSGSAKEVYDENLPLVNMIIDSAPDDVLNYDDFCNVFKDFLGKDICYVEEQDKYLRPENIKDINYIDFDKILVRYIAGFFYHSWVN